MSKKRPRKVRVDFRTNRQRPRRPQDLTRRYRAGEQAVEETERGESVRAKGALSRKRTILVDENDLPRVAESAWRPGVVTKVHGRYSYVRDEAGRTWECTTRRVLRTLLIASRAPITVGDRVWFSDHARLDGSTPVGAIEQVAPRTSALARRDRRKRAHTIVANADQILIVLSVAQPRLRPHLADRYIVAALKGGLTPVLCFNKSDLLDETSLTDDEDYADAADESARPADVNDAPAEDEPARDSAGAARAANAPEDAAAAADTDAADNDAAPPVAAADDDVPWDPDEGYDPDEWPENYGPRFRARGLPVSHVIDEFRRLGYACFATSAVTGAGLAELRAALKDHITVLAGQSGVGKSTLLNAIQPGLRLATAPVSAETQKGRHTTTFAELLPLDAGGFVVDTPGIRSFDLWDVKPGELEAFFVEFLPHLAHCRFHNCLHRNEEDCAVRSAVERGEISLRRYLSYVKMFDEV